MDIFSRPGKIETLRKFIFIRSLNFEEKGGPKKLKKMFHKKQLILAALAIVFLSSTALAHRRKGKSMKELTLGFGSEEYSGCVSLILNIVLFFSFVHI